MSVKAVIPLRFADCCLDDSTPLMVLSGQPLWEITIKQALESAHLNGIIAAYDDDRFLPLLAPWTDRVTLCRRPPLLSEAGFTTLDVMAHVAETLTATGGDAPQNLMLLEITHPLRPKGIIDQMIETGGELEVDSLITCHRMRYNFWRQEKTGAASRIRGGEEDGKVSLYQELTGICSLLKTANLITPSPLGDKVDIVPIE